MDCDKVLQVIPCFRLLDEVGTVDGSEYRFPVVGIALTEDKYGNRKVVPLSIDDLGQVDSCEGFRVVERGAKHDKPD